jgi:deoxyadenosine/deoxycytidine kinase
MPLLAKKKKKKKPMLNIYIYIDIDIDRERIRERERDCCIQCLPQTLKNLILITQEKKKKLIWEINKNSNF